ncbi:biotin transport system substrate-specific component [Microbacterium sp. AG1240]|uniref:biotin transporter BioY n=1 Tax=Microbacterium sp. AG1240 TaxID=2183992 RepID=UPI000EB4B7B8|nr:biotin transporter BioY [Microbacterium sp. AG1240]RKT37119.1 biotin transport system substrate-specific component [Microbacterium sp. AG1240]
MSVASPLGRRVLADLVARPSTRARAVALDATLVLTGALTVAVLAQVEVPLWPVPITGQTLGVIVVGAALGARRGALSLLSYLGLGLVGLPVFAGLSGGLASVVKPSFGFIIGFVLAAFVAGWFAERSWDRRPVLAFVGFAAASVVPFLIGVPYMAFILNNVLGLGYGLGDVLAVGVLPFIVGGIVKAALAAGIVPAAWALVRAADRRR